MKILTIGNIIRRKRLDLCALACAVLEKRDELAPLTWEVIGKGEELEAVRKLAPSSMHFLPRVDSLKTYYQNADIFVLPSYDEGFGMVYVEAIMCGCPVVATRGEGATEIVEGTGGGLLVDIPASDSQAVQNIVDAVLTILANRSEYMNPSIIQRAVDKMSPSRIRAEWDELIRSLGGDTTRSEPAGW